MVKTPTGYFSPFVVEVVGVENRPVAMQGVCKKGPFLATKWAKNGVILVGLDLGP